MNDLWLTLRVRASQLYSFTARLMRSGSDINKSSPTTCKCIMAWAPDSKVENKSTIGTWHSSRVVNFFECSQSSLSKGCSMETTGYSSVQKRGNIRFMKSKDLSPRICKSTNKWYLNIVDYKSQSYRPQFWNFALISLQTWTPGHISFLQRDAWASREVNSRK